MRTRTRLFLGALTAAVALAGAVNAASANRLSISSRTFRQVWTPLSISSAAAGVTLQCNVTLEGSFHYNTFAKVRGLLLGYITKAAFAHPCTGGGEAFSTNGVEEEGGGRPFPSTLPWHITYSGFEGALPNITGVQLNAFLHIWMILPIIGRCLYEGLMANTLKLSAGTVTALAGTGASLPIVPLSPIECPATITLRTPATGRGFTVLGSATLVTLRLI
jgi:hypothetical protein